MYAGTSARRQDERMPRGESKHMAAYVARVRDEELPACGTVYELDGGIHENYGSYGSPGPAQGLAYKDLPATMSPEEQCELVAAAIVATASV